MKVLIAGIARSGTSWVGETLARAPGTAYLHEPDNRQVDRFGGVAKRGLGVYGFLPALRPGDRAPRYATMWDLAFRGGWPDVRLVRRARRYASEAGGRRETVILTTLATLTKHLPPRADNIVVKSVQCPLALEWVAEHTGATVVVVRRPVAEVVGSWLSRNWVPYPLEQIPLVRERILEPLGVPERVAGDRVAGVAWTVSVLYLALDQALAAHPEWIVVDHPELCTAPLPGFRSLFERAGMPWSDEVERFVCESDRPGEGFATQRVASQERDKWMRQLSRDDAEVVREVTGRVAATWRSSREDTGVALTS